MQGGWLGYLGRPVLAAALPEALLPFSLAFVTRSTLPVARKTLQDVMRVTAEAHAMWTKAHSAIERAQQTHENVQAQVEELARQNGFRHMYLDRMLARILGAAMASVESTVGSIQLLDTKTNRFVIHASHGIPREGVEAFSFSEAAQPSLIEEIRSHRHLHIPDITNRTFLFAKPSLEAMLDAGARSMQIVDLPGSAKVAGVLCTIQTVPYRPTVRKWLLLDYYARCAASLVELYGNGVAKH